MKAYRICELKNNELLTLFHKVKGSRKLKINKWIKAEIKLVKDGNKKTAKIYFSGFHILSDLEETRKFSKKFTAKRDLVIVSCDIGGRIWEKKHSSSNILLAEKMKINEIIEKI